MHIEKLSHMGCKYWNTALFSGILLFLLSCSSSSKNEKIVIFHAGSLSVPLKVVSEAFKKENPGVEILMESSGSLAAARKITDLNKSCDILAVADYQIIDNLMVPNFTDSNIAFASNEMVIAYLDKSMYSGEINQLNWYEILQQDDATIGRSNPDADPCGYRSLFVFKLAEAFYQKLGISKILTNKVGTVIRPKEVDLLALLETGNIDYLMIYKSVALQHKLKFIALPDELNLGNPSFEETYKTVSARVLGSSPLDTTEIFGSAIVYSFCFPKNSQNIAGARAFADFLLDPEKGGKLLEQEGMKTISSTIKNK